MFNTPLASSTTTDFQAFIESLSDSPSLLSTSLELEALLSIYGDDVFRLHDPTEFASSAANAQPNPEGRGPGEGSGKLRYEAVLPLPENEDVKVSVLVTIPPGYPESESPPQLQLLDRYVGDFGVDSGLFGRILRTYFSIPPPDGDGIPFASGEVAVWEGLEHVRNICQQWYTHNLLSHQESSLLRSENHPHPPSSSEGSARRHDPPTRIPPTLEIATELPEGVEIFVSEPIVDRKSVFVGRSVRVEDVGMIPIILNHLLEDKKVGKASHPIIHAYRVKGAGGGMIQDNDDDGESAAGSRIAHLLQILDVTNVLVIVTRWFGGTHIGPDRFKHIGQCARDALEVGGFLDDPADQKSHEGGKGGKHGGGGKGAVKGGRR
ncbi:ribosomal protein S5 domain 2-type protein [Mrakia frigida]|uniref:IMPACT family protein n=1 Tax=Mrakia frigida TaxID=29902 RepID=UPI003FCBFC71